MSLDKELYDLVTRLASRLREENWRLVTAESCTGGAVAFALTELPGSSSWFDCGFVTYSNASKQMQLGVPSDALMLHGAVSEPVVEAMVSGALANTDADVALAVSGVAGPAGGTPEKPVGTICLAWKRRGKGVISRTLLIKGNRQDIREASVRWVLTGLLEYLE